MGESPNIWLAFGQTFAMLAIVLAALILGFYLMKKFSAARGNAGTRDMIKVLTVHHLSPKEKLVLVNVLGDNILIGVTSSNISKIASIDKEIDLTAESDKKSMNFSQLLTRNMAGMIKMGKDNSSSSFSGEKNAK